jgi:CheY-like chemotaxis protein
MFCLLDIMLPEMNGRERLGITRGSLPSKIRSLGFVIEQIVYAG